MPERKTGGRAKWTSQDTSAAVDAFMKELEHPFKPEIEILRRLFLGLGAGVEEGIKWKAPSFRTSEYFATMNLRAKDKIGVILHLGAKARALPAGGVKIDDPAGLLTWLAKDRAMIELEGAREIEARRAALEKILRQWVRYV